MNDDNDDPNEIIKDLDSISSSNMEDDGMSSMFGGATKSVKKGEYGTNSEINFNMDSASISNFRQEVSLSQTVTKN